MKTADAANVLRCTIIDAIKMFVRLTGKEPTSVTFTPEHRVLLDAWWREQFPAESEHPPTFLGMETRWDKSDFTLK